MKLPQVVPILTAFTARVAGRGVNELLQSPTALARALADTQTIVGHDGVLNIFDPMLLSSACISMRRGEESPAGSGGMGVTPADEVPNTAPVSTLLESIQPLRYHLPDRARIYVTFAGPGLLWSQLQSVFASCGMTDGADSDYVLDVTLGLVRCSLELKADGVALIEKATRGVPSELQGCHKTVRKMADFYESGFLLFRLPTTEDQAADSVAHCVFDLSSPDSPIGPLAGQPGQLQTAAACPTTTTGDVPEGTAVEALKALLEVGRAA